MCCGRSAASQRRRLSPVRVKVRSASGSGGFGTFPPPLLHLLCRHEAEAEEAAAVRRAGRSCPSFPPQCRAVVFVSGPSVRQLARPSGRSGRHSASAGKDLGQFGGAGRSFLCCYKEREFEAPPQKRPGTLRVRPRLHSHAVHVRDLQNGPLASVQVSCLIRRDNRTAAKLSRAEPSNAAARASDSRKLSVKDRSGRSRARGGAASVNAQLEAQQFRSSARCWE